MGYIIALMIGIIIGGTVGALAMAMIAAGNPENREGDDK